MPNRHDGREDFKAASVTLPIAFVGTAVGSLVCAANMYFGMQLGSINTMATSSALISFTIFRYTPILRMHPFTPVENVIVQTIACSVAGMPIAASMLSVIPALEFLRRDQDDEGGKRELSVLELIIWSLGVSLFGIVIAAPLRKHFIVRERLLFPSGFATAVLVGLLHRDDEIARATNLDENTLCRQGAHSSEPTSDQGCPDGGDIPQTASAVSNEGRDNTYGNVSPASGGTILVRAFSGTTIHLLLTYFVPGLKTIPVFGRVAAREWLWLLDLSPAFMAFGMLLDVPIACSMMLGAVLGWGVLSPLAKSHGWAPGPADDMETGARGWLIWIIIAFLLGDSFVRLLCGSMNVVMAFHTRFKLKGTHCRVDDEGDPGAQPLLGQRTGSESESNTALRDFTPDIAAEPDTVASGKTIMLWSVVSAVACAICTRAVFGQNLPLHVIIIAIFIAFPLALPVIQSTGETDTAPVNTLSNALQFLFVLMISDSLASKLVTMIAGAITEAGLWQSAVFMTDLKTAYLVNAPPRVMFKAQLIGFVVGCIVSW
ncbi:hypothetical protein QQX98_008000 [Neonectria punicea]|uniref:Oligopeptide transporter n=1 Tax=Neonectria punicea TaxID=979145 RepID=A0ABR1GWD1_9HYPO